VAVAVAVGERLATSVYRLRTETMDDGVWVFTTLRSEGTWEEPTTALYFDSDAPRRADPWPLTLQHAISSVPAAVRLDSRGAPLELVDAVGWEHSCAEAIAAVGLPSQSGPAGTALVDTEGYLADLRRNFPGMPPRDEVWTRRESVAGLAATREEECEVDRAAGVSTIRCVGEIRGDDGRVALTEGEARTTVVLDRAGLLLLESEYEATLTIRDQAGGLQLADAAAGRRLVQRREVPGEAPAR
jgi:hypothetical protein